MGKGKPKKCPNLSYVKFASTPTPREKAVSEKLSTADRLENYRAMLEGKVADRLAEVDRFCAQIEELDKIIFEEQNNGKNN